MPDAKSVRFLFLPYQASESPTDYSLFHDRKEDARRPLCEAEEDASVEKRLANRLRLFFFFFGSDSLSGGSLCE